MRSLAARRLAAAPLLAVLAPTVLAAAPLTVHGTALTPAGAPLAGARAELLPVPGNYEMGRLRLAGGEPAPAAAATTDALGGYALAAPGPGVYAVRLRAAGAVPLQSVPLPLVEDLELPPATPPPDAGAALLVRDAAGAARAGLWVLAEGPPVGGGWRPAPRVGRTSADGSLSLPRAAGEALTVRVFTAVGREEVRAGWTGGAIALAPQPAPARRLRVRDVQGRPVPDVLVRAGEALWPIGLTGADGGLDVPATAPRVLLVAPDGRQQPAWLGRAGDPVVLADAVPLAGTVVAAETKQPLAGALVWSAADPGAAQVTDAAGRYVAVATTAAAFSLEAWAPGRLPQRAQPSAAHVEARRIPALALERAAALSGRVVDAAGRGVAAAWIGASLRPGGKQLAGGAASGPDGAFTLGRLRPAELYHLRAAKAGYLPVTASAVTARPGPAARRAAPPLSLVLVAARAAVGQVVDPDGRSVAGAEVRIGEAPAAEARRRPVLRPAEERGEPEALSDAQGRFRVAALPALAVDVAVTREGYARAELRSFRVPPGAGPVDLGRIRLVPAAGVAGQVVDTAGRPIAGAAVFRVARLRPAHEMADELREEEPDARTGADGRFALSGLAAGTPVHLLVTAPDFLPATARGIRPPTPQPLLFRLEAGASLAGRVLDEEERPVPGAGIEIAWQPTVPGRELPAGPAVTKQTTSDGDGRFAVPGLRAGVVVLAVDARGFVALRDVTAAVPLPPGEEVTVRLERGATLEGRVVTTEGEPVPETRVLAGPAAGVADAEGRFRVEGVAPGPQLVEARHPHYGRRERQVSVEPGTNPVEFVFEAGQEVSGRVVDRAGMPVAGAAVRLASTTARDLRRFAARADAGGAFLLSPVGRGAYRLQATADGYADSALEEVRVEAEPVADLTVVLDPAGTIRGRVLGLDPAELAQVEVEARRPIVGSRAAEVGADGSYRIDGLAAGNWLVVASLAGGQREVQARVPLGPGAEAARDLVFDGGLSLAGVVLYRGSPLPDTLVSARGQARSVERATTTDHEGRFRLEELEADTYWLGLNNERELVMHNQTVELPADREMTIEIERASVAGRVVDAASRGPVAEAVVALRHLAGGDTPEFMMAGGSDEAGLFELLQVPPGRYLMTVSKEGYGPDQRQLEVTMGGDAAAIEVALEPSPGVELDVRLASGRTPALLHLRLLGPGGQVLLADSRPVGRDGRVRLATAPPGDWTLLAAAPAGALTAGRVVVPGKRQALTLPDAARLHVRVGALAASDALATLRLLAPDGRPFETLGLGGALHASWPVVGGGATVEGVPAGSWLVEVTAPDGQTWRAPVATDGLADAAVALD